MSAAPTKRAKDTPTVAAAKRVLAAAKQRDTQPSVYQQEAYESAPRLARRVMELERKQGPHPISSSLAKRASDLATMLDPHDSCGAALVHEDDVDRIVAVLMEVARGQSDAGPAVPRADVAAILADIDALEVADGNAILGIRTSVERLLAPPAPKGGPRP